MTDHRHRFARRAFCASALALATAAIATPPTNAAASKGIVGTWRLVSFEDVENGKMIQRFGEKPVGLFVYTADGHISIQIANPANPACIAQGKKSGPGRKDALMLPACTPEQAQALLDGTVTYWGTYTVDMPAGVVTHHVLSGVSNGYAGTLQPCPFRLNGDRLVIGDGKTWTRVLERVGR